MSVQSTYRVANRWLGKTGATTPLPDKFPQLEPGLMTLDLFLKVRNPQNKHHPSDAYDWDLFTMNKDLSLRQITDFRLGGDSYTVSGTSERGPFIITEEGDDGKVVAVIHQGTLYGDKWVGHKIPEDVLSYRGDDRIPLGFTKRKIVKYPHEYTHLVSSFAKSNLRAYSHLEQRLFIKGEALELRFEETPTLNRGVSIAILNPRREVVAVAQDEFGATLLAVAKEYRGLVTAATYGKKQQ